MNNDLISRKDLYIAVDKMFEEPPIGSPEHEEWDGHTPDEAIRRIGTLAMVKDAEPVRHREWILNPGDLYNDATWVCSACGHEWTLIDGTPQKNGMHYCPNRGAKMDGGVRHESDHQNSL